MPQNIESGDPDPQKTGPEFSVIIPTYNRLDSLIRVIDALENQVDAPDFEVIVVNDGSTDATEEWLGRHDSPCDVRVINQNNQGPATARNKGIRQAKGIKIALLGDDTIPQAGWLAAHDRAHLSRGNPENLTIIGYTTWHPRIKVTRFLEYINEQGHQFGFSLIEDPEDLPFNFFYTSNMSLSSALLKNERFDEAFAHACWEDIELGYRLKRKGMRMVYAKDAVVYHDHFTSIRRFAKREEMVGYSAVNLYALSPEIDFLGLSSEGPLPLPSARMLWLEKLIVTVFQRWPLSFEKSWEKILRYHYLKGLHRGWEDAGKPASG
jgi:GT2 family glycosyltransferase